MNKWQLIGSSKRKISIKLLFKFIFLSYISEMNACSFQLICDKPSKVWDKYFNAIVLQLELILTSGSMVNYNKILM